MKTSRKGKLQIGLLLLPGLLIFGIFTVYPIVKLFIMSFFEWDFGSMLSHRFIGLGNYIEVLGDEYFRTVFVNSLVYTIVTVPGQMQFTRIWSGAYWIASFMVITTIVPLVA